MIAMPHSTPDLRTRTEHDPAFRRIKTSTIRKLTDSIRQYVRDLRAKLPDAQTAFINRQIGILHDAYVAGYTLGSKQYWQSVSRIAHIVPASAMSMIRQRMGFYAPSIVKMAAEGMAAWHRDEVRTLSELGNWQGALDVRIRLQADLTWSGAQDGYVEAGASDSSNPYAWVEWQLDPVAKHCQDCPAMAEGSPYGAPGSGQNELRMTPGDGHTACGAACKCNLRYVAGPGPAATGTPKAPPAPVPPSQAFPSVFSATKPAAPAVLSNDQKRALDMWRFAQARWTALFGDSAPPLPALTSERDIALPLDWERMTPEQQAIATELSQAYNLWIGGATDDQQFGEVDSSYRLMNPNHYPAGTSQGGQFAPNGTGGGSGSKAKGRSTASKAKAGTSIADRIGTPHGITKANKTAKMETIQRQSAKAHFNLIRDVATAGGDVTAHPIIQAKTREMTRYAKGQVKAPKPLPRKSKETTAQGLKRATEDRAAFEHWMQHGPGTEMSHEQRTLAHQHLNALKSAEQSAQQAHDAHLLKGLDAYHEPPPTHGKATRNGIEHETVYHDAISMRHSPTVQAMADGTIAMPAELIVGKHQDLVMASLNKELHYDGHPDIRDVKGVNAAIKSGETEMFRGVSQVRYAKAFMHGDLHAGLGVYGNGTHTARLLSDATRYSQEDGVVMRMTLKKGAKVATSRSIQIQQKRAIQQIQDHYAARIVRSPADRDRLIQERNALVYIASNPGRFASLLGYDAIRFDHMGQTYMHIVLNRTAVRVQSRTYSPETVNEDYAGDTGGTP